MSSQPPSRPSDSDLMPPPPRPPARTQATDTTVNLVGLSESDSDSGTDTAVPPTPHARTRRPKRSTEQMLDDLRTSLQGYQARANYCCGGSIPVQHGPKAELSMSSRELITAPPIVLRFDNLDGSVSKLQFPIGNNSSGLERLLSSCTPATFGSRGKYIPDETYPKAGKLDRNHFSVDFHPYDYGIIDTIAQALLPGINRPIADENLDSRDEHWGVRAELYQLDIYSAPSGKFRKHVDTPLVATQFGSLVVCLPYSLEGGQLLITYKGQQATFDWSNPFPNSISWSAFYSNCTHEILPVTAGHCITLTYKLFVSEHIGGLLQRYPTADPSLYPLYQTTKSMLAKPNFLPEGGTLGFFCTHTYAHTRRQTESLLPYSLKGLDSTLFSVFCALGLQTTLRPVLGDEAWDEYDEHKMENWYDEDHDIDYEDLVASQANISRVGDKFYKIKMVDVQMRKEEDPTPTISRYLPLREFSDVIWLNEAKHEGWDIQMVNLKYGNEASLMWHYSHAAILVDVPPMGERVVRGEERRGMRFPDWRRGGDGAEGGKGKGREVEM